MCPQAQTAGTARGNSRQNGEELVVYDSSKEHQLRRISYDSRNERAFDYVKKLGFRVVCLSAQPEDPDAVSDVNPVRQQRALAERIGIYGLFDSEGKPVKDEKGEPVRYSADTGEYWVRYADAPRDDQRRHEATIRPPKLLNRSEMIPTRDIGRAFVCHGATVDSLLRQAFTPVEVKDEKGAVVYTVEPQANEYLSFYRARRAGIDLVYRDGVLHMRHGKEKTEGSKQTAAYWPGAGRKFTSGVTAYADLIPTGVVYELERLLKAVEPGSEKSGTGNGKNKQESKEDDWKDRTLPAVAIG